MVDIDKFLKELSSEFDKLPEDLHVTRKACALVAISGGKVIKVQEPEVKYCPLFKALFSHEEINRDNIEDKFLSQTSDWGMFTGKRKIKDSRVIVPFGASEMIMYALKRGDLDAAVLVCEGAGTIVTNDPEVVQGIGAYMNGVFYTSPIKEIIKNLKEYNVNILSEKEAKINQLEGVKLAVELGYRKIAVTVRGDESEIIKKIRDFSLDSKTDIVILAVCNSGIDKREAEIVRDNADLGWACASKEIRRIVGPISIVQVGVKIPVFVITRRGVDFISNYSKDGKLREKLKDFAKHLAPEGLRESRKMGESFSVHLLELKEDGNAQ
ncbi:MAG: DUF2099 family protein, partial [Candidatus Humimicrobiaceae bacterium]